MYIILVLLATSKCPHATRLSSAFINYPRCDKNAAPTFWTHDRSEMQRPAHNIFICSPRETMENEHLWGPRVAGQALMPMCWKYTTLEKKVTKNTVACLAARANPTPAKPQTLNPSPQHHTTKDHHRELWWNNKPGGWARPRRWFPGHSPESRRFRNSKLEPSVVVGVNLHAAVLRATAAHRRDTNVGD